jgi:hypothetical protein
VHTQKGTAKASQQAAGAISKSEVAGTSTRTRSLEREHVQNLLTSNTEGEPVSAAEQGHDGQTNLRISFTNPVRHMHPAMTTRRKLRPGTRPRRSSATLTTNRPAHPSLIGPAAGHRAASQGRRTRCARALRRGAAPPTPPAAAPPAPRPLHRACVAASPSRRGPRLEAAPRDLMLGRCSPAALPTSRRRAALCGARTRWRPRRPQEPPAYIELDGRAGEGMNVWLVFFGSRLHHIYETSNLTDLNYKLFRLDKI